MSDQGSNTPAGWYPDPSGSGGQRYWDGQRWTEHTTEGTPTASWQTGASASGGVAGQPTEPFDPWLWQSIVSTVCCCLPLGIVGIVYASQAQSAMSVGNRAEALEKARQARLFTLIGVGIAGLFYLGYALLLVTGFSSMFWAI